MTLVVDAPAAYEPERRYILEVILRDWLGLDFHLRPQERADVRITVSGDDESKAVVVPDVLFCTDRREWLTPASLPRRPLAWHDFTATESSAGAGAPMPILYARPPIASLITDEGSTVRVGVDVFGSAFFMLSRYEEIAAPARDGYGRFPAASSLAHGEGFLRLPIVDMYVELLWSALRRRWPGLERKQRQFHISLSHDVDSPLSFLGATALGLLRQLGADVLRRRDARLVYQRIRSWIGIPRRDHRLDPYNTFDFLMTASERHGIASVFNFMATEGRNERDGYYAIEDPWIGSLMDEIHRRGHELGFHAGYSTYRDASRTKREFDRLRAAAAHVGVRQSRWGGRQHYLRWQNPDTWANWEEAGLEYDSTVGFADGVGFRAGTCHEFRTFQLSERRPLRLYERPLVVMDATLFEYMRLTPDAAAQTTLEIARQCKRYDGTLTLLWHNSSLPTGARRRWYEGLLEDLSRAS